MPIHTSQVTVYIRFSRVRIFAPTHSLVTWCNNSHLDYKASNMDVAAQKLQILKHGLLTETGGTSLESAQTS